MRLSLLYFLFLSIFPWAVRAAEFQTINPALDGAFVSELGLYQFGDALPSHFNILIVGQDNSSNRRTIDGRPVLGSRADIIMVLSISTSAGQATISSIYRGNRPSPGCVRKLGFTPSSDIINGVYTEGGREQFIPCVEGMLEERFQENQEFAELLDQNGEFQIHAFFEGTRTHTIGPVARQSFEIVKNNKWEFISTFGMSAFGAAMNVLNNGEAIQTSLSGDVVDDALEAVDTEDIADYLIVELKERDAYKAAGYQRAFNFATVIADVIGWTAYGIDQYKNENYEFLGRFFGDVISQNFSTSHDFNLLEQNVLKQNGDHLFRQMCFVEGRSPVRIVQWGSNASSYVVYENGEFKTDHAAGSLRDLEIVTIVPTPPSCN